MPLKQVQPSSSCWLLTWVLTSTSTYSSMASPVIAKHWCVSVAVEHSNAAVAGLGTHIQDGHRIRGGFGSGIHHRAQSRVLRAVCTVACLDGSNLVDDAGRDVLRHAPSSCVVSCFSAKTSWKRSCHKYE